MMTPITAASMGKAAQRFLLNVIGTTSDGMWAKHVGRQRPLSTSSVLADRPVNHHGIALHMTTPGIGADVAVVLIGVLGRAATHRAGQRT